MMIDGALVESAEQVEQQLPAGLALNGEIAEFVEDDEIEVGEIIGEPSLAAGAALGLELIDEIDGGEEATARSSSDAASRDGDGRDASCPCRSRQRHGAGRLASEETISYAFHPLAGMTVASTGRRVVHGGVEHITIRLVDGTLTLTPAWMMRPEAAACAIR